LGTSDLSSVCAGKGLIPQERLLFGRFLFSLSARFFFRLEFLSFFCPVFSFPLSPDRASTPFLPSVVVVIPLCRWKVSRCLSSFLYPDIPVGRLLQLLFLSRFSYSSGRGPPTVCFPFKLWAVSSCPGNVMRDARFSFYCFAPIRGSSTFAKGSPP